MGGVLLRAEPVENCGRGKASSHAPEMFFLEAQACQRARYDVAGALDPCWRSACNGVRHDRLLLTDRVELPPLEDAERAALYQLFDDQVRRAKAHCLGEVGAVSNSHLLETLARAFVAGDLRGNGAVLES